MSCPEINRQSRKSAPKFTGGNFLARFFVLRFEFAQDEKGELGKF
jgi:hypothetical protein